MKIGFIGLGVMGEPIAKNLIKAGFALTVFNRSVQKTLPFRGSATIASSAQEVFQSCDVTILMVPAEKEIADVLGFEDSEIKVPVAGKTIVNMATISPESSEKIAKVITISQGKYIEAPVSGSRKPAEMGELIILAAGDKTEIEKIQPVFSAIGKETIIVGSCPNAMRMKLASNLLSIAMQEALVESFNFAKKVGVDTEQFLNLILAGQMANNIFKVKASKLMDADFTQQAPIKYVLKDLRLICQEAQRIGIQTPVAEINKSLYEKAAELGLSEDDIIGVLKILEKN